MVNKQIVIIMEISLCMTIICHAQTVSIVLPSEKQLKWKYAEMGAIFHYDLHVFDESCYNQKENRITPIDNYNIFNPKRLNTDQWLETAASAGCKFAIMTATHETGFGLWQSDVNPFCLKSVKWKDGQGDILHDFVQSCRKYGILPSIYIGIRWNSFLGICNFEVMSDVPFATNRQMWYKHYCERMVEELCTRYGNWFLIWFDGGADDPRGNGPDVEPIIAKYQPQSLFYHNVNRADFRWGGAETGIVGYPCWSTFPYPYSHGNHTDKDGNHNTLLMHGDPTGQYWVPAMADFPLRGENGRHEWFWEPNDENSIYSLEDLMDIYEKSVGRNATLVVGLTPDPNGLIPVQDEQRLKEWGKTIKKRYGVPLMQTRGNRNVLVLDLKQQFIIDRCIIQEDITSGERIRKYRIDVKKNGKWMTVCEGSSVGHKRIETFEPVETTVLRLVVAESIAQPKISNFSVYTINK